MKHNLTRNIIISVFSIVLILALIITSHILPTHAAASSLALSVTIGPPTTVVTVNGEGFGTLESVTLDIDNTTIDTPSADSNGTFITTITIPSNAQPGNQMITAIGQTSGNSAQAIFLVQTDWSMSGFDASHSSFNPYENTLTTTNVSNLVQEWNYVPESSIISPPIAANGMIYIYHNDTVSALNAATGVNVWNFSASSNYPLGEYRPSLAYDNGIVYFGSGARLYALNANNGTMMWKYITHGIIHSPTISNGVVYFGSDDHYLYAILGSTGVLVWRIQIWDGQTSPAIVNGVVYITSPHTLSVLNAATGSVLWQSRSADHIYSSPEIANGVVYYQSALSNGKGVEKVVARSTSSGAVLWNRTGVFLAIANDIAYISSYNHLIALNPSNNTVLWTFNNGTGTPIIANGVVYVGSYVLKASTGEILWSSPVAGSLQIVSDGKIYIIGNDGILYAFHLSSNSF